MERIDVKNYVKNLFRQPIQQKIELAFEVLKKFRTFFIVFAALGRVLSLIYTALKIYFLASLIKLAVPKDYSAFCSNASPSSKSLMFILMGIYGFIVIYGSISKTNKIANNIFEVPLKTKISTAATYLLSHVFIFLLAVSIWIWIFVRVLKLWNSGTLGTSEIASLALICPIMISL